MLKECKPRDKFLKTHNELVAYMYIKNQKENGPQNVKKKKKKKKRHDCALCKGTS